MAGSAIRVLIAEDHAPLRRFVSSTVQKLPQMRIVGEASDGLAAIRSARQLRADIILLDLGLPKLNGFEVARQIREHIPQMKIIFLSAECSLPLAEEALRIGADGYVLKSDAGADLVPALEAVLQGRQFVSASLKNSALRAVTAQSS